jgi:hypothetical protein
MRAAFAIYLAFGFGLIASPATATCTGSDGFSTCSDNSGNSIQRFYSGTGSTGSQHSALSGNTTLHEGESDGNFRTLNLDQNEGRLKDLDNDSLSINGHDDDVGMKSNGNNDSFGLKW